MRKLSNQEVRECQMQILDNIHSYCHRHELRYSLAWGTLLGAVRHKGYIPWDDDIDIMMPRPDYDAFIQGYMTEAPKHLALDDRSTNPDYVSTFAKVMDIRTKAIGPNIIDDRNVFVDVFCINGMPDEDDLNIEKEVFDIIVNLRRAGKYYKYTDSLSKKIEYFAKYCIKRINTPSTSKSFRQFDQITARYPWDTSRYAGHLGIDGGVKKKSEKSVFLKYSDIRFENRTYRCIADYDTYLTNMYGDYMSSPPVKDRVPTHFDNVFINE